MWWGRVGWGSRHERGGGQAAVRLRRLRNTTAHRKGWGEHVCEEDSSCSQQNNPRLGPDWRQQAPHANQRTCCPDAARSIQAARMLSRAAALLLSIILSSAGSACLTKLWVLWEGWGCVEERGRPCARVCLPACAVDQEQQQLRARAQVKRARALCRAPDAPVVWLSSLSLHKTRSWQVHPPCGDPRSSGGSPLILLGRRAAAERVQRPAHRHWAPSGAAEQRLARLRVMEEGAGASELHDRDHDGRGVQPSGLLCFAGFTKWAVVVRPFSGPRAP